LLYNIINNISIWVPDYVPGWVPGYAPGNAWGGGGVIPALAASQPHVPLASTAVFHTVEGEDTKM
jgi:hypothetical protein